MRPRLLLGLGDTALPVLLFSHGLGTYRSQSTFQVEELASHGYVIAAIQHPYDSTFTLLRDGTGVPYAAVGERAVLEDVRVHDLEGTGAYATYTISRTPDFLSQSPLHAPPPRITYHALIRRTALVRRGATR